MTGPSPELVDRAERLRQWAAGVDAALTTDTAMAAHLGAGRALVGLLLDAIEQDQP